MVIGVTTIKYMLCRQNVALDVIVIEKVILDERECYHIDGQKH